jgi:glyoxylase-like metal-dependent hydrolase (beta-lactamase superfamily II)
VPIAGEEQQELWNELDALASDRPSPVAILLTVHWHERSIGHVFERYSKTLGACVFAHRKAIERVESPVTNPFEEGDELPGGIEAFEAERADEVVFWLAAHQAVVAGDVLLGRDGGVRLCPPDWVGGEEQLEAARSSLRRLLDLPVERILVSHGPPVLSGGHAALERALS